ncbi:MAG: peptidoglycan editing factor PgeF [Bryobacteraceae bacterium]
MSFRLHEHVYRSTALDSFDWLTHGFGDRSHDCPASAVILHQIHSDRCVTVGESDVNAGREGDALLTDRPGRIITVKTADCLPIFLVDERQRAIAAVHAGWKGTALEIARKAVAEMMKQFGTRAEDLHAAIGPGIGACCFEVGPEVAAQFRNQFPERSDLDRRTRVNLAEANRRQLAYAGLARTKIYTAELCTVCERQFHSYRRDREASGRMYSYLALVGF